MKIKTSSMLSKLGHINDEEFKVLFFILNTINMNSGDSHNVKIYRAVLADLCGKSERTISRITDKLDAQGLIVKDSVSDGTKLYNYYSIPKQKTTSNLVTDDRVKELKESKVIKEKKVFKEIKRNKEECIQENISKDENKKEFEIICEAIQEELSVDDFDYTSMNEDFQKECEEAVDNTLIPIPSNKKLYTTKCY